VTQRTREIGIRVALGARGADVIRMVLHEGMLPVVVGGAAGIAAALAATRAIRTLLFGVTPLDAVSLAAAPAILAAVALLACYIPARRATRVDSVGGASGRLRDASQEDLRRQRISKRSNGAGAASEPSRGVTR
jgi:ABC-type antimicrobial peptide transport system permease subunit